MSDDEPFSLIERRWIPVRRKSGTREWIAPWEITKGIFDDPIVRFDWPRPDFDGASHEFLIGLLSTAAAPEDEDAWHAWAESPPWPEVLHERFKTVASAFNLDGTGPRFMQDLDELERVDETEIAALLIDAPGGQTVRDNKDFFVRRGLAPRLSRVATAIALFTLQTYAPAGGKGHRTSLRGGGPLTTLVVAGEDMWSRLWPNVESAEACAARSAFPGSRSELGAIFPWLVAARTSDPKSGGVETTPVDVHPLQVYWGMPRRIRLIFESAGIQPCALLGINDDHGVGRYRTMSWGTNYGEGFNHPLSPYYRDASRPVMLPVHGQPTGIVYRHWLGLVVVEQGTRVPAQAVTNALSNRVRRGARLVAFGYDMDNMKARAWLASEKPLVIETDPGVRGVIEETTRSLVAGADLTARAIVWGIKSARFDSPKDARGDFGFVSARFWRETESAFFEKIAGAQLRAHTEPGSDDPAEPIRHEWRTLLERTALNLFDELAPIEGVEDGAMHRVVAARFGLVMKLKGWGKEGAALYAALAIPAPTPTKPPARGRKPATKQHSRGAAG